MKKLSILILYSFISLMAYSQNSGEGSLASAENRSTCQPVMESSNPFQAKSKNSGVDPVEFLSGNIAVKNLRDTYHPDIKEYTSKESEEILIIGNITCQILSFRLHHYIAVIASYLQKAAETSSDSSVFLYNRAIQLAMDKLKPGMKFSQQKPLLRFLVKGYLGLGLFYYQKVEYKQALANYEAAYQYALRLNEPYYNGDCLFYFAEVCLEQSLHRDAMLKYTAALSQYQKAGSQDGIFWCYSGMGIVQKQSGNFADAILCYNKALTVATHGGMKNEVAYCYNNLGNVYRKQGDFPKAMASYQKAITEFNKLNDELAASDCLNNIGNLYLEPWNIIINRSISRK